MNDLTGQSDGGVSVPPTDLPSEAQIRALVHRFYERIRDDAVLGPIFSRVIGDDWSRHLALMCDFWSSVMLSTGRYKGRPVPAHLKIDGVEPDHFTRWLTLFRATARELFVPALAEAFILRAERIAESLKLGFAFHSPTPGIWADLSPLAIPQTRVATRPRE